MESVLSLDDIQVVIQELAPAANKWWSIGILLGLNEAELKSIESKHPRQHLECLYDVIFKWLYLSDGWPPDVGIARRRSALIEVLRSPDVGETQLADQLTKKYSSPFPPRTTASITKTAVKITTKPSLTSVTTTTAGTHSNATTNLKAPCTGTTKAPATTITPGTSTTKPPGTGTTKAPATTITPGTSTTKPPGMGTTKPPGTTKAPAITKAPGTGTTKASGSTDVASSKDGGGGKVSGRLESTVAGLKRKKLHADSAGGDRYLLRKKLKSLDERPIYDPPSYDVDDFATPQPLEMCCVRCKRIPRKPLRLLCCDKPLYCEPCAIATTTCSVHAGRTEYKMDSSLRGKISKLTVMCAEEGCEAKCAVYQMRDHLTSCKSRKDKATTSSDDTKRRNVASSAKILDSIDSDESMEVDVISLDESTNQTKEAINTSLNLQREPLQKTSGEKPAKDQTPSPLSSTPPTPQLPPLAEVIPSTSASGIPTLSQLQSTLSAVMVLMNNTTASSTAGEVPTTLKLPGGKEIKLGVTMKSEEEKSKLTGEKLKKSVPREGTKVVTKLANSGGASSQATMIAGLRLKQEAQKTVLSEAAKSAIKEMLTRAQQKSDTTTTTTTSTVSSLATPPVKVTTPTPKLVKPLSLVTTPTGNSSKSPSDESLQLGEAFTLSPSHQAKILSHTSELYKTTTQKKGAASAKASVTSKRKAYHPSRTNCTLTLSEVETELKSVATKWRKLGRCLNPKDISFEQISAENGNSPDKCLSAVLLKWHAAATGGTKVGGVSLWMNLLKMLRNDVVGEKGLADSLQDKYGVNVKIVSDKPQPSSEVTPTPTKSAESKPTPSPITIGALLPNLVSEKQQPSSEATTLSKSVPTQSEPSPSPITIGALLANLPSNMASSAPSSVTPPTSAPTTTTTTKATPIPSSFLTPTHNISTPQLTAPPSTTSTSIIIPPNIVTCSQGMPTVGSAMASIGQVDVYNVLKNSPVLQSIPALRNLSGPLTANDLLQKLMEIARKASPTETATILKSLQQVKPPSGASSSAAKVIPSSSVTMATAVTMPSTKSTPTPSKATITLTSKKKGPSDLSTASLASSSTAKDTTSVASSIQKTAPDISTAPVISTPSDTPIDVDVSKGPTCTTVTSAPAKSTIALASPSKSIGSKSPMSVAVEIPKVKLSGATIAGAMMIPAVKTSPTLETINPTATCTNTGNNSVATEVGSGVKTRQKQKPKQSIAVAVPDSSLISLSDEAFSMKPRRELHCSKCNQIPMNPQRPKCSCNVVYCDTCANAIPNCPLCGKNQGFEEDRAMRKRIWNLKVPCTYRSQGCDWKGELCKRGEHDLVCPKRSVPCKYEVIGCGEMVRANELSNHELECREQHLQLAMDTVVRLVHQVKALQDEVEKMKKM